MGNAQDPPDDDRAGEAQDVRQKALKEVLLHRLQSMVLVSILQGAEHHVDCQTQTHLKAVTTVTLSMQARLHMQLHMQFVAVACSFTSRETVPAGASTPKRAVGQRSPGLPPLTEAVQSSLNSASKLAHISTVA